MESLKLGVAPKRKRNIYIGIPAFLLAGVYLILWPPLFYLKFLINLPVFLAFLVSLTPYFFVLIALIMIAMLMRYRKHWNDQLVLSEKGFIDNAGFGFKRILIEWDDIKGYKLVKRMNKQYMFIDLEDNEKYLNKISSQRVRNYLEKMKIYNGAYIGLALDWYEMPKEDIIRYFDNRITKRED